MSIFVVISYETPSPSTDLINAVASDPDHISSKQLTGTTVVTNTTSTALELRNHIMSTALFSGSFIVLQLKEGVDIRGREAETADTDLYDWLHKNIRNQ